MTLAEIAELVERSRAAGLTAVDYRHATGMLSFRLATGGGAVEGEPSAPARLRDETVVAVKAPCAGVFLAVHPANVVASGELVAFLRIGPCLRGVAAPRPGLLRQRAEEHRLVGYGEVLFEIEP